MKKIMIIVWKWGDLIDKQVLQDLVLVEQCKNAMVIRINEPKTISAEKRLLGLINQYPNASFQFFLHRGKDHFYNSEDVKNLRLKVLKLGVRNERVKVFLFGSGADFIYFENSELGLIDTVEGFMSEKGYTYKDGTVGDVKVLGEQGKIKYRYFLNTWRYYQHEFSTKIQQLHMDLMNHSVDLKNSHNNHKKLPAQYWINKIQEKDYLWLQLKSFLGYYNSTVLADLSIDEQREREYEFKQLQHIEAECWQSYSFDDCIANFTLQPSVRKKYHELTKKLEAVFIEGKQSLSLVEIQQDFDHFLRKTLK